MTIMAAGASGCLEGRTGNYVGKDFWFSERLKYMARAGNGVQTLGYIGFAISVMQILTDDQLSSSDKVLRICTEMLFFGITNYLTGALAAAMVAPIGTVALPVVVSVALAAAVAGVMAYALLTIKLMYFAGLRRAWIEVGLDVEASLDAVGHCRCIRSAAGLVPGLSRRDCVQRLVPERHGHGANGVVDTGEWAEDAPGFHDCALSVRRQRRITASAFLSQ